MSSNASPERFTLDPTTWPKPKWRPNLSMNESRLSWGGHIVIDLPNGTEGHVRAVKVDADMHGRFVDDSWETIWSDADDDEISVESPPWEGFAEYWQDLVADTLPGQTVELVQARFTMLDDMSRQGLPAFSHADVIRNLNEVGPVHHAYQQAPEHRTAALLLADSWTGTYQEFVDTLPNILDIHDQD